MTQRRLYLDEGAGERRGVVTLDGRPERLLIERDDDLPVQALGARVRARVRRVDKAVGLAFLDLGDGPDAVLNLAPAIGPIVEGEALVVEIRTEARGDKGATVRLLDRADGAPGLMTPGPSMEQRLRSFDADAEIVKGAIARSMADGAQDEAVRTVFSLTGGGDVAVQATRALIAVDVDIGARAGAEVKRVARAANFAALTTTARILRLKGLGGLIVIDLVGRGHDGPALLGAARQAFGPDNPGVAFGPISRFGTLELTIPRRARPAIDRLVDMDGVATVASLAMAALRSLEREAVADHGARLEVATSTEVADAARPFLGRLTARLGERLTIRGEPGRARGAITVRAQ